MLVHDHMTPRIDADRRLVTDSAGPQVRGFCLQSKKFPARRLDLVAKSKAKDGKFNLSHHRRLGMEAMMRMSPPHSGQQSGNTASMRTDASTENPPSCGGVAIPKVPNLASIVSLRGWK